MKELKNGWKVKESRGQIPLKMTDRKGITKAIYKNNFGITPIDDETVIAMVEDLDSWEEFKSNVSFSAW
jgi:hypothetical protein